MSIRIPEEFISGFEVLIDLSLLDVKKISNSLEEIPAGTGPKAFKEKLSSKFKDIDFDQLSPTIYSLGSILLIFSKSKKELSTILKKSLEESLGKKLNEELKEKIHLILNKGENLKYTFKAFDLISDNDSTYRSGKIYSDVRFLFDKSIKTNKENRRAVIIHKLKMGIERNGENKSHFISLDSNDLIKLRELVNRAINKEEQIRFDYSNINFIEITD